MRNRAILWCIVCCLLLFGTIPYSALAAAPQSASDQLQYRKILQLDPVVLEGWVRSVAWIAWSPDAKKLAVAYEDEHTIRIMDSAAGKVRFAILVPEATLPGALTLAWSHDNKYLAGTFDISPGGNGGVIKVWEIAETSARLFLTIKRPGNRTSPILWSTDGTKLVSTHFSADQQSGVLSIWDARTGKLLETKERTSIGAFGSSGAKFVVYNHIIEKLQMVDAITFKVLSEFPDNSEDGRTRGITWTSEGSIVAGLKCPRGDLCRLWTWNVKTGKVFKDFEQEDHLSVVDLAFSPSGKLISVLQIQADSLNLWDATMGKALEPLRYPEYGFIDVVSWHPTRDIIALGGRDGSVQIWEILPLKK
jgi:WD40 repeat protein